MEHGLETEQLWSQMHDRLLSYIRRQVAGIHDAEDILQEVFVRIHANLHRLKNTQSITGWIYRIARNAITDYQRRRAVAARALTRLAEDADQPGGPAGTGTASDAARRAGQEFTHCLEPLLGRLPEHYRQAVTLTELDGLSQKDAARKLGLSVSGMKARVQRGRGKLKDVILDCCNVQLDRRGGLVDYERRAECACDDCGCD